MDIYLVRSTYIDYYGDESTSTLGVFSSEKGAEDAIAITRETMKRQYPRIADSYSYEIEGPLVLNETL